MQVLEVKDLQIEFRIGKRYVPAVSGVSFSIESGKTLGVVGESGCGKSVTASAIMRLLPKANSRVPGGSVTLLGKELLSLTDTELNRVRGRDISMIFQEPMTSLNPVHTIGAQLREMYLAHVGDAGNGQKITRREADAVCIDMLNQVGIPAPVQRMKEFPHQLSGGMRQRVMIAMALMCNPALLIADEPTTALDVTIQAQILELLQKFQKERGSSVMLITHDMGVIAGNADYVVVMYAGEVVEYNDVVSVFTAPRHPYTYGLLQAVPRVDADVERLYSIDGIVPTLEEMPEGCRFCNRCAYACGICRSENPGQISISGGNVRCWLYRDDKPQEAEEALRRFETDVSNINADTAYDQGE
ncbi:MAG: ABC transporter ATP-binding protein [Oscillospiraceae bacterium]|nr:ABC transporter ATP-binding protein [Oscillospiraceae bacterium]